MEVKKTRIVLADDNIDLANIICEYLSNQDDFEVVGTAVNGLEAIELITDYKPDIAILDIVMPHVDGLGVLEKINSLSFIEKPQFIMLSAIGNYKITQIALNLGAEYFMIKPFDLRELVDRIRQIQSLTNQNEIRSDSSNNLNRKHEDAADNSTESHIKSIQYNQKNLKYAIGEILREIGVPTNLKGYHYLLEAIRMSVESATVLPVTKLIYPNVSKKYKTNAASVERAIRKAIEMSWSNGDQNTFQQYFVYPISNANDRPSNSEFITAIAEWIRIRSAV